jgi:hypothetical protein
MALMIPLTLYWTPVTVVSISLPDWSVVYIKDFKTEMMGLESWEKPAGGFQKFKPNEFSFLSEHGDSNRWRIWIEVNNKEKGISCLIALANGLVHRHFQENGKEVVDNEFHSLKKEFLINHALIKKSNDMRYILLIIAIIALAMKMNINNIYTGRALVCARWVK